MSEQKLDQILDEIRDVNTRVTRMETSLAPDPGKPSRLTQVEDRVNKLELWRSALAGAWAVVIGTATYFKHK